MKTYVIVGLGGRSMMFQEALAKQFKNSAKLLAICDNNAGRLKIAENQLITLNSKIVSYSAENFDKMLAEQRPDYVIVTTKDCDHDDYICRSLEAGCDVITEKPMTIDEKRCQRIIDTKKKPVGMFVLPLTTVILRREARLKSFL